MFPAELAVTPAAEPQEPRAPRAGWSAPDARAARETPEELVLRIVERHHAYERRALPYLVPLLAKVAGFHRHRSAKLGVLCDVGQELAERLEAQLDDEERDLFPALLSDPEADGVRGGLEKLRRHHAALGLFLARIRWLADDFAVPPWAGRAYQTLMEELAALEEDVLAHVHLERALLGVPPA